MTVWLVTVGDTEKNFRRLRDAVAWLVRLTHDERPLPTVHREHAHRYVYYGSGDLDFVIRAGIDRLGFPPLRFYKPRGRKKRRAEPVAADALDRNEVR